MIVTISVNTIWLWIFWGRDIWTQALFIQYMSSPWSEKVSKCITQESPEELDFIQILQLCSKMCRTFSKIGVFGKKRKESRRMSFKKCVCHNKTWKNLPAGSFLALSSWIWKVECEFILCLCVGPRWRSRRLNSVSQKYVLHLFATFFN